MKKAMKNERLFNLDTIDPSELQALYDDGTRGQLSCFVCRDAVKLYLGIENEPHFFHSSNKMDCREAGARVAEPAAALHDGFRLPRSRGITAGSEPAAAWRQAVRVKTNPVFRSALQTAASSEDPIQLDLQQKEAVMAVDGPVLVLSGAGSGKTRVLTARTAYMIARHGIDPGGIMLVTFTAKASREMKERLLSFPGLSRRDVNSLICGTFHSIFYRILIHHEPGKWTKEALLKWEWEKVQIVKAAGRERDLDEKLFAYDQALQQIGLWKNSLQFPDSIKAGDDWEEKCLFLYRKYEEYKVNHQKYDFDDMLLGCYLLLDSNPEILEKYQKRFTHFLIDEFQDINKVQYELIRLLAGKSQNICAVGDDDQSIYSFRGSDPAFISAFEQDFDGTKVIKLTNNYRSAHEIVGTANSIIRLNSNRREKSMNAQHDDGPPPMLFFPYDEEQEATMIVTDLKEKIAAGRNPGEFAILYRTHSMSRAIFERLSQSSLPFAIDQDADSFYDRKTVRSMLSYLRLSLNPESTDAITDLMPSLFLKQNVLRQIKADSILNDCSLLQALSYVKTSFAFQEKKLKKLPQQIGSLKDLSPVQALEAVEKELGFQDFIKKRGNEGNFMERGSDDVRDLKVAARRFRTIAEFLDHAEHMKGMNSEVKKLSKHFSQAIQLTTIHRSKGLEYGTVYVIGNVDGGLPHDYALDSYRKGDTGPLEEERRLLYVAATRARNELYLSIPHTRRGRAASPSRFLRMLKK
ncbi:ATP-dependent helicase [Peribacillus sp. SCS-37]|uniref:ATP-dependent helicase n=1 Tax=Paraperibacillus esterisolvens TaxID=3115296 RepID=UPI003906069B